MYWILFDLGGGGVSFNRTEGNRVFEKKGILIGENHGQRYRIEKLKAVYRNNSSVSLTKAQGVGKNIVYVFHPLTRLYG